MFTVYERERHWNRVTCRCTGETQFIEVLGRHGNNRDETRLQRLLVSKAATEVKHGLHRFLVHIVATESLSFLNQVKNRDFQISGVYIVSHQFQN